MESIISGNILCVQHYMRCYLNEMKYEAQSLPWETWDLEIGTHVIKQ